eukprot:6209058-Pleurochrysis_carterae.AAC.2
MFLDVHHPRMLRAHRWSSGSEYALWTASMYRGVLWCLCGCQFEMQQVTESRAQRRGWLQSRQPLPPEVLIRASPFCGCGYP